MVIPVTVARYDAPQNTTETEPCPEVARPDMRCAHQHWRTQSLEVDPPHDLRQFTRGDSPRRFLAHRPSRPWNTHMPPAVHSIQARVSTCGLGIAVSGVGCTVWALTPPSVPGVVSAHRPLHRERKKTVNVPAPAGTATLIAYVATIPAANLAVTHFGAVPAGFGYTAPAGVYMVGLALVLRDLARESAGRGAVLAAIAVGTILSYFLADPALAVASAAAFGVAETMDFAVYEPLRQRGLLIAMLASNAIGLLSDSLLFLKLAFDSFEYLPGQILGKAWMTLAAVTVLALLRRRKQATA